MDYLFAMGRVHEEIDMKKRIRKSSFHKKILIGTLIVLIIPFAVLSIWQNELQNQIAILQEQSENVQTTAQILNTRSTIAKFFTDTHENLYVNYQALNPSK